MQKKRGGSENKERWELNRDGAGRKSGSGDKKDLGEGGIQHTTDGAFHTQIHRHTHTHTHTYIYTQGI